MKTENTELSKLGLMIKDLKFTMLSTVSDDGMIHSRPMANLKINLDSFVGILYFFSKKNSFKNHDILSDQNVNLAYTNPDKQQYISISGKALIENNDKVKMNELWTPNLEVWFPEGIEDPKISLIGVKIVSAEIWDSPPSKVHQIVGLVKSAFTRRHLGEKFESQHIELQRNE